MTLSNISSLSSRGVSCLTVSETSLRQKSRNVKNHTVISCLGQGEAITAKRPKVVGRIREEQALSVMEEQRTKVASTVRQQGAGTRRAIQMKLVVCDRPMAGGQKRQAAEREDGR